jgi:hypothetical protein
MCTKYSEYIDDFHPRDSEPAAVKSFDSVDQKTLMLKSHTAVKSFLADPAVLSALFEFVSMVMLTPSGLDLVSPLLYNSIPSSFLHAAWGLTCCRPLAFCSFVPDVSTLVEAFDILSLSELVTLTTKDNQLVLPIFQGAAGVKIKLPSQYGSFSVLWSDGRTFNFVSSPDYSDCSSPSTADHQTLEVSPKSKATVCRHWSRGHCKLGSKCKFEHPVSDSSGGSALDSSKYRKSVAESIALFENKLRARGDPASASASPQKCAPLSEFTLDGHPCRIVFHHEGFEVSIAPIYIPCFSCVQELAVKDPSSDDITTCALSLCTRYGMFDQALKILDLIASADRTPSLAEYSLAIASVNASSIDSAVRVLKCMESCGHTAASHVIRVLAHHCASADRFDLAHELIARSTGDEATNSFGLDLVPFSQRMWPLILDSVGKKEFDLFFDSDSNGISNLLVQFSSFLPASMILPFAQQAIAGSSQQGGRFEASLSRFRASKAKCKNNSDDGNTVFAQLMEIVAQKGIRAFRSPSMEAPFEVKFKGEDGRDRIDRQGGGLFRECCSLLCAELQSAALPILIKLPAESSENAVFALRPSMSTTHRGQRLLEFFGALLGMALHCGEPLNLHLDASTWIAILGHSQRAAFPSAVEKLHPLVKIRHQRIEGLKQLLLAGEAAFDETVSLGGDWEFCVTSLEGEVIDLVPQGRDKTVTFKTCRQLISLLESFVEHETADCSHYVQTGLCRVVPMSSLLLLRWQQLEEMVCGQLEVSWEALRSCLRCGSGYNTMRDVPVQLLCETLSSFTSQQRSMFLRFVSGRSRLPRAQSSPGSVQCIHIIKSDIPAQHSPNSYLPKAHTCFFQLELPAYSSAEVCRQRLLYAISNCQEVDGEHQHALRAEDLAEFR